MKRLLLPGAGLLIGGLIMLQSSVGVDWLGWIVWWVYLLIFQRDTVESVLSLSGLDDASESVLIVVIASYLFGCNSERESLCGRWSYGEPIGHGIAWVKSYLLTVKVSDINPVTVLQQVESRFDVDKFVELIERSSVDTINKSGILLTICAEENSSDMYVRAIEAMMDKEERVADGGRLFGVVSRCCCNSDDNGDNGSTVKRVSFDISDEYGRTPLHWAAIRGKSETVKVLLEAAEAADSNGHTPLHFAAVHGNSETVKILLEANAEIEAVDRYGKTPLYFAAVHGKSETVKILLEANAEIEGAYINDGQTLLHFAAHEGNSETVKVLLEANANAEAVDSDGQTPLHWVASSGNSETVKILLEANAEIEAANRYGNTPLHWAASSGNSETVKILLEANAEIEAADSNGQTPLDHARYRGHEGVIRLLESAIP